MIEIRAFRNEDPPRLAAVWRAADLGPAAMQPMTPPMLEACVFSKPYFDRLGLLVALDDGQMVGFAQAGFGPNADRSGIDTREDGYIDHLAGDSRKIEVICNEFAGRSLSLMTGGGCASSPRWPKISSIAARSTIAAMISNCPPPQVGQCCKSGSRRPER